jgi:hypothetical protein
MSLMENAQRWMRREPEVRARRIGEVRRDIARSKVTLVTMLVPDAAALLADAMPHAAIVRFRLSGGYGEDYTAEVFTALRADGEVVEVQEDFGFKAAVVVAAEQRLAEAADLGAGFSCIAPGEYELFLADPLDLVTLP